MSDNLTVSDVEFARVMEGGRLAWVGINTVYLMRDEITRLREIVARAYMRLQCADVPRQAWHGEVSAILGEAVGEGES